VVIPAAETPVTGDRFGQSIAVFEDESAGKSYLAVGAPQHDGTGSVFIYERNQGVPDNWGFVQILQDVDLSGGDGFGTAVDGLGNTLAIGSHFLKTLKIPIRQIKVFRALDRVRSPHLGGE
jgi:hypothetical protein